MTTNDYCEYMFKVPLLHLSVRNWDEKKSILLEMLKKSNMDVREDEEVISDYHTQKGTVYSGQHNKSLEHLFKEEINLFCNHFGFASYKIVMSWFETAKPGHYHGIHNHGSVGYSAVCYIDYNNDIHTPTQFVAPFNNFIDGLTLDYVPNVKEGSLIFFPSVILHYTEPNKSDIERTVVSFNIDVKENHDQRPRYS